jgi:hypothetical protein
MSKVTSIWGHQTWGGYPRAGAGTWLSLGHGALALEDLDKHTGAGYRRTRGESLGTSFGGRLVLRLMSGNIYLSSLNAPRRG